MNDSGGRRSPRFRLAVIAVILVVVSAITVGATLLVEAAEWRSGVGPVLHLLTTGIMLVLSGVCINSLPGLVVAVWRLTPNDDFRLFQWLHELGSLLKGQSRQPQQQQRRQRLRLFMRLSLVMVTVAALVAAGVSLRPPPTGLEPGPLVVMTAFAPDPGDVRSMLLDQWNRLNPNNQASFDYAPVNSDEQHDRMVNDAKPGAEQRADLYVLDIVWMAEFTTRGYLQPLDESKLDRRDVGDFVPKALATCSRDGKLWALPFNSDVGLIFHRSDIPGVQAPRMWEDYSGAAAKATLASARTSQPGIEAVNAAQLAPDDEMFTITALEAVWAAGGLVVGPNGQPALTADRSRVHFGPADLAGIEKLAAASRDAELVLTEDDEAKKTNAELATQTFGEGRTLYMRNWPVARDALGDKVPFAVAAPPTASVLGGQNLAISSSTDKPRAAQALIQFLTNPSSQQLLSEVGGFVPTRQVAFSNSRRPDIGQIQQALNDARLRLVTPCYVEFSRLFRQGVARALNNNGKLEDNFAQELAKILKCP